MNSKMQFVKVMVVHEMLQFNRATLNKKCFGVSSWNTLLIFINKTYKLERAVKNAFVATPENQNQHTSVLISKR